MPDTLATVKPSSGLSRGMVLLFAVACGLSVANLYYAQPVLESIAKTFGTSSGTAGLVVTLAQIGYAAGLALLVPVGDLVSRRRLVPIVLLISAGDLVASALAPDLGVLIAVALIVGAGSVMAQVLVPMAASLASDDRRGQVVGTVMSGLLLGILLARTVSGVVADVSSWRVVYAMAAALMVILAVLLRRVLPEEKERPRIGYASLLRTTATLLLTEPILRRRAWFGALGFASFSVFWTTMAFLLSGAPYHYRDLAIGLFGLVGAGGALCATFAGRWADQKSTKASTLFGPEPGDVGLHGLLFRGWGHRVGGGCFAVRQPSLGRGVRARRRPRDRRHCVGGDRRTAAPGGGRDGRELDHLIRPLRDLACFLDLRD